MIIKKDFILRDMDDMCIVVAVGESAKTFNGVINLNETAKFMWKQLEKGCTKEQLIDAVLAEYDVSKETVEADVDRFVGKLSGEHVLDE